MRRFKAVSTSWVSPSFCCVGKGGAAAKGRVVSRGRGLSKNHPKDKGVVSGDEDRCVSDKGNCVKEVVLEYEDVEDKEDPCLRKRRR